MEPGTTARSSPKGDPVKCVKTWPVTLRLTEEDGRTEAELLLETGDWTFDCAGRARRRPGDPDIARVGDELAVGRALIALGNRLVALAELDIAARELRSMATWS
jgi:hypothetical protein